MNGMFRRRPAAIPPLFNAAVKSRISLTSNLRSSSRASSILVIAFTVGGVENDVQAYSSIATGYVRDDGHSMGGGRPVRRRLEAEHVQEQTHRPDEGQKRQRQHVRVRFWRYPREDRGGRYVSARRFREHAVRDE